MEQLGLWDAAARMGVARAAKGATKEREHGRARMNTDVHGGERRKGPQRTAALPEGEKKRGSEGRRDCWLILDLMRDGRWRTIFEIAEATEVGVLSVGARLRNLREPGYGAHVVESRVRAGSAKNWEYRVVSPLGA